MLLRRSSLILTGFLFFILCAKAMAHVTVLVGAIPAPQEVIVPPQGYVSCYAVPADYYNGMWIVQHNECQYANSPGVWVAAHWTCSRFNPENGMCGRWRWVPSYWAASEMAGPPEYYPQPVVYGPPPPVVYGPPVVHHPHVVYAQPPAVFVGFGDGPYYHRHWR